MDAQEHLSEARKRVQELEAQLAHVRNDERGTAALKLGHQLDEIRARNETELAAIRAQYKVRPQLFAGGVLTTFFPLGPAGSARQRNQLAAT